MRNFKSGIYFCECLLNLGSHDLFGRCAKIPVMRRAGIDVCIIAPPNSYLAQSKYYKAKLLLEPEVIKNSISSILDLLAKEFNPNVLLAGDDIAFQLICKFINDQNGSEKARELLAKSFPGIEQLNTFATESMFIKNYASFKCTPPPSIINPTLNDIFDFINRVQYKKVMPVKQAVARHLMCCCQTCSSPSVDTFDKQF